MGKIFQEAIKENLFLMFKDRFCSHLSNVASKHLFDETSQKPQFIFDHNALYKRLDQEFELIELQVIEKLNDFSTPEKLWYLLKLPNDYSIENNLKKMINTIKYKLTN